MEILGVEHVQLAMPDGGEPVARKFYRDLLGLREVPKPAELQGRGGAWFESSHIKIHLGIEKDFRPAKKAHPALLVSGIEQLQQTLKNEAVTIEDGEQIEGYTRFFAFDPFGNRIEFLEAITSTGK